MENKYSFVDMINFRLKKRTLEVLKLPLTSVSSKHLFELAGRIGLPIGVVWIRFCPSSDLVVCEIKLCKIKLYCFSPNGNEVSVLEICLLSIRFQASYSHLALCVMVIHLSGSIEI